MEQFSRDSNLNMTLHQFNKKPSNVAYSHPFLMDANAAIDWSTIQLAEAPAVPWKNGGGVTRELLTYPNAINWTVRISVAHIEQDGSFSVFDGITRWFAVLSGAGVQLEISPQVSEPIGVNANAKLATKFVELSTESPPFQFDGADKTYCNLIDGPTTDFNLMTTQNNARLERVQGPVMFLCSPLFRASGATRLLAVFSQEAGQPSQLFWAICSNANPLHINSENALVMEVLL
jgi:uncharacterized protein